MIYSIYLLLFILGIMLIFLLNNLIILIGVICLEFILNLLIFKIRLVYIIHYLKKSWFLILSVAIVNALFLGIISGISLSLKLLIITLATLINTKILTTEKLSLAIKNCLFFLKNKEDIALIIIVGVSFVPVFSNIINNIKLSLKAKNFQFNLRNIIFKGHILFITFFYQIFKKTDELELILISRGFNRN